MDIKKKSVCFSKLLMESAIFFYLVCYFLFHFFFKAFIIIILNSSDIEDLRFVKENKLHRYSDAWIDKRRYYSVYRQTGFRLEESLLINKVISTSEHQIIRLILAEILVALCWQ